MPAGGVRLRLRDEVLSFEEIGVFVGHLQRTFDVGKVRLTGGEPLVRSGLPELVRKLAGLGIPDLAMTTNGQSLAAFASELKSAGLHRVNISLDSLDPRVFSRLSRGGCCRGRWPGLMRPLGTVCVP
jgi:cyclic pyranopterin phosphate synthase